MDRAALAASLFAFLLTGSLYLATMSRTYGFIDRGELAAVSTTLGIAHRPAIRLLPFSDISRSACSLPFGWFSS